MHAVTRLVSLTAGLVWASSVCTGTAYLWITVQTVPRMSTRSSGLPKGRRYLASLAHCA